MSIARLAVAALAAASLAAAGPASAAPATIDGSVGPGFTISLKKAGKKVSTLKPGTYRLVVKDRSSAHDFHIKGPGLNKVVTGVGFTGQKTVTITLKKGTYQIVCDPHSGSMHGAFTVR